MAETLEFPGRSFSVEEWRRRWQAAGFGEEPGATHDRVFWCPTRPLLDGPSLRARLSGPAELQWKKARRVLNAASAKHGQDPSSQPSPSKQ